MDENKKETIVLELTLVLIYLTGWEETKTRRVGGIKTHDTGEEWHSCLAPNYLFLDPCDCLSLFLKSSINSF